MKLLKQTLCAAFAVCLLFTAACGGKQTQGTPGQAGRYVETDITPPVDGWFMSFSNGDSAIVCFDSGLSTRYDSVDSGESWSESPGPGRNSDRYSGVRSGTLLPDGRLLAYIQDEGLELISPDGSSEHYPVADIDNALANGESAVIMLIQSLGNDRLMLSCFIGGMSVQGGRPIGQPSRVGTPASDGAQSDAPTGDSGSVTVSEAVTFSENVTVSGPDSQDSGPQPQGYGTGPREPDSDSQSSDTQGPGPRGANSSMSMAAISRKTALYELSSGRQIAEIPDENIFAATSDDETIYVMDSNGSINKYNMQDGSPSGGPAVNLGGGSSMGIGMVAMLGSSNGVMAMRSDSSIYAIYSGNLLLCGTEGDVDTILEGTAYSIGAPNSTASSVHSMDDGSIIVCLLDNMQSSRLYKYVWDENASINPSKTLSVWSLEENAFVRAAIAELRKNNPDSYISYEVALGGDSAVSATDAIKTLNTRLLSDNGPDVIILDGCPAESYADRGILLELSDLVDTGGIYQNLVDPYVSGGKMYCLPTQFLMPALMGSSDALGKARTLEDLVSLAVNGNDTPASRTGAGASPFTSIPEDERAELFFEDLKELCDIMWMSCAPAIVVDNRLDTEALKRYLEAVKAISDKYALTNTDDDNMVRMGVAFASAGSGGRATVLPSSLVRYTSQITNLGAFSASNLMLLQLTIDRVGSDLSVFPGLVSGAWRPSTVAGVSADTDVADFAAELLRAMLSVEVQQINYGAGLPVTREGVAAQIKAMNDMRVENGQATFDIDMHALIGTLRTPSVNDTTLEEMMQGSVEKLCRGETDVEGAVREIEQNIKNYLAERA